MKQRRLHKNDYHRPMTHRLSDRFWETSVGLWLIARMLPKLDRIEWRRTNHQDSFTHVPGVDVAWLTTIGARSGLPRSVPVLAHKDGERIIVIASNFGQAHHPSWYYNLLAHPDVVLEGGGQSKTYVAREAAGEEREYYWQRAVAVHPKYRVYADRATGRILPIIVLTPKLDGNGSA